jgi:solute carrier family 35 protein F5
MAEQAGGMLPPTDESGGVLDPDLHLAPVEADPPGALRTSSRYALGLLLLAVVVCLWVASSTLIQLIFVDMHFSSPFFLTYYSTCLFSLYLPLYALRQLCRRCCTSERSRLRAEHTQLSMSGSHLSPSRSSRVDSFGDQRSPRRIDVLPADGFTDADTVKMRSARARPLHDDTDTDADDDADLEREPLLAWYDDCPTGADLSSSVDVRTVSVLDTAKLSLYLCPIWFSMNYAFNVSLDLTSIASSTILSTTASLFVLMFSYLLDSSTKIRAQQVIGVFITIAGVGMISWKDTEAASPSTANAAMHPLTGDVIATLGSIIYGLYTVLLKLRIPDENAVEMQLVFGFLGLFNTLIFWPGFFIVDAMGIEPLVAPPTRVVLFLTLNGIFGTVISDFLWAKSVLLTSPLISSLGLALTIPLAIIVDWFLHDLHFTVLYFLGGLCVLLGFILVNLVHSQAIRAEEAERSAVASLQTSPRIPADIMSALRLDEDDGRRQQFEVGLESIQLDGDAFEEDADTLEELLDDHVEFQASRKDKPTSRPGGSPTAYL